MKELENELSNFKSKIQSANQLIEVLTDVKEKIDNSNQAILGVKDFFEEHNNKIDTNFKLFDSSVHSELKNQFDSLSKSNDSFINSVHEQLLETRSKLANNLEDINNYLVKTDLDYLTSLKTITEDQEKIQNELIRFLDLRFTESQLNSNKNESNIVSLVSSLSKSQMLKSEEIKSFFLEELKKKSEEQFEKADLIQNNIVSSVYEKSNENLAKSDLVANTLSKVITDFRSELFELVNNSSQSIENSINLHDRKSEEMHNLLVDKLQLLSSNINEKHDNLIGFIKASNAKNEIYAKEIESFYTKQIGVFKWVSFSTLALVLIQAIYIFFYMN